MIGKPFPLAFVIVLLFSSFASGESYEDGNWWLRAATLFVRSQDGAKLDTLELMTALQATAYIQGFNDASIVLQLATKTPSPYCLPKEGIQPAQVLRIMKKYLEEHPEQLYASGRILLLVVLQKTSPCSKQ